MPIQVIYLVESVILKYQLTQAVQKTLQLNTGKGVVDTFLDKLQEEYKAITEIKGAVKPMPVTDVDENGFLDDVTYVEKN